MKKFNFKDNKGVTLIALVITIIVLIILAGVSITALTGEKGLINQAKDAKGATRAAAINEACDLYVVHHSEESSNIILEGFITSCTKPGLIETPEEASEIRDYLCITIDGVTYDITALQSLQFNEPS